MQKVWDAVHRIVDFGLFAAFLVMVFCVFTNVIVRYFGMAFNWADEVARLAFVWMALLAAVAGFRLNAHPSFEMLLERLAPNRARFLLILINLLTLVFLAFLLVGGIKYVMMVRIQKTALLGISVAWKYSAVPVTVALMSLEAIGRVFSLLSNPETDIASKKTEVM